eukprot:Phypoly_transcript_02220.p1 GENE.Phypoly_transcript_02220~~Phypoly_transcript_02220.p1  ORF type:complete len:914 (+),score=218.36 Phypoly_transcript_02220:93-2834(+)
MNVDSVLDSGMLNGARVDELAWADGDFNITIKDSQLDYFFFANPPGGFANNMPRHINGAAGKVSGGTSMGKESSIPSISTIVKYYANNIKVTRYSKVYNNNQTKFLFHVTRQLSNNRPARSVVKRIKREARASDFIQHKPACTAIEPSDFHVTHGKHEEMKAKGEYLAASAGKLCKISSLYNNDKNSFIPTYLSNGIDGRQVVVEIDQPSDLTTSTYVLELVIHDDLHRFDDHPIRFTEDVSLASALHATEMMPWDLKTDFSFDNFIPKSPISLPEACQLGNTRNVALLSLQYDGMPKVVAGESQQSAPATTLVDLARKSGNLNTLLFVIVWEQVTVGKRSVELLENLRKYVMTAPKLRFEEMLMCIKGSEDTEQSIKTAESEIRNPAKDVHGLTTLPSIALSLPPVDPNPPPNPFSSLPPPATSPNLLAPANAFPIVPNSPSASLPRAPPPSLTSIPAGAATLNPAANLPPISLPPLPPSSQQPPTSSTLPSRQPSVTTPLFPPSSHPPSTNTASSSIPSSTSSFFPAPSSLAPTTSNPPSTSSIPPSQTSAAASFLPPSSAPPSAPSSSKSPHVTIIANGISYYAVAIAGNGSFGVVLKATQANTGELVAIKKVLVDPRFKNRELQIMKTLNHPNIVALRNSFYTSEQKNTFLNIVLDYIPETLHRVARQFVKSKTPMPLLTIKLYIFQLCRAIAYLHAQGICHRDIKPQNVLLEPASGVIKLCDFGSAKMLVKTEANVAYICSRYYRAPELIFGATNYTTSIDVWSVGCVFAELILGAPLFPGESGVDQLVEIIKILGTPTREQVFAMNPNYTNYKFPNVQPHPWAKLFKSRNVPPDCIDLLSKMLVYNPATRAQAWEVCAHPFFNELRDPNTRMPVSGAQLPPLFNFTPEEKASTKNLYTQIVPPFARS